jgi:4-amino-4-deoxy-L-arabinose transferase-like glycosyltransferase
MLKNLQKARWVEYFAIAFITAIAAGLRFYKLAEWSPWVDELYTLSWSLRDDVGILEKNPYCFLTEFFLNILGVSPLSLRLPAFVFGIISIPILYFPFKALLGRSVALLAVFLMAISPWHIYLSQLARWYTLLLLVSGLSLFSFYYFIENNALRYLDLACVFFITAITLHLTGAFVLVIGIIYLLLLLLLPSRRPSDFNLKIVVVILALLAVSGLAFLPKFLNFVKQWASVQQKLGYWGSTPIKFSLKALYQLTPSIASLSLAGLFLLSRPQKRDGLFLATYCFFPPLVLNLVATFDVNVSAKYIFFTLPGLLLAASYICIYFIKKFYFKNKVIVLAFIAAIIFPSLQANYLYFTSEFGNRERLKEALQFISQRISQGDQIYLDYLFYDSEETRFYVSATAALYGLNVKDAELVTFNSPERIDPKRNIWLLTRNVPAEVSKLDESITKNTNLMAEFKANRGPDDNTIKVYRFAGESSSVQFTGLRDGAQ